MLEEHAEIYYLALSLGKTKITSIPEDAQKYHTMLFNALNGVKRKKKKKKSEDSQSKSE